MENNKGRCGAEMGKRWGVICAELGKVEGGVVGTKKKAYLCALIT